MFIKFIYISNGENIETCLFFYRLHILYLQSCRLRKIV